MEIENIIMELKMVAEKEGIEYDDAALNLIAQKADGGMRDALSIFDQVTAYCDGNITYKQTIANLNVLDYDYYFKLVDYFLGGQIPEIMSTFNEIINKGFEGNHFINGLNAHLRNLLMCRDEKTTQLLDTNDNVRQRYIEQSKKCKPQFLYRAIRKCTDCDINYKLSQNKRLLVEITLIEIAQSTQDEGASAGRRPAKTLKPLFNRAAVKKSVAAAQPAVSTTATPTTANPTTAAPTTATPTTATPQQEAPNKSAQPAPTTTPVPALPADATFDEENLTRAIKIFSQTLPHGGIRAQLFRLTPRLLGADSFEIEVDNPAIEAQMRQYLPQLTEYVKTALKMSSVRAVVKVAEFDPTIVLTNAQYYAKMKEKNPVLAILEKEMQLHL
jgi:DNA polymerase-3 subunit gamma/tau